MVEEQSSSFKFGLVFFAFKSCVRHPFSRSSVDRIGKHFDGLLIYRADGVDGPQEMEIN